MKNAKRTLALLLTLCMVIPMCLVSVVSAEESEPISYEFIDRNVCSDEGGTGTGTDFFPKAYYDTFQALYENYKSGSTKVFPFAVGNTNSTAAPKYYNNGAPHSSRATNFTGLSMTGAKCSATGGLGDWFAVMIKNPGAGNYTVELDFRGYQNGAQDVNVYMLPASSVAVGDGTLADLDFSTFTADTVNQLQARYGEETSPIPFAISRLLTEDTLISKDVIKAKLDNNLPNSQAEIGSVTIEGTDDYIVVFECAKGYNNTAGITGALLMSGINLYKVVSMEDIGDNGIYNFVDSSDKLSWDDTYAPVNGVNPSWDGAGTYADNYSILKANYETNKFLPMGDNVDTSDALGNDQHFYLGSATKNAPALSVRQMEVGDWMAVKIKNPGTGTLDVNMRFYRTNGGTVNVYIIPESAYGNGFNAAAMSDYLQASAVSFYAGVSYVDSTVTGNGALCNAELGSFESNAADGDYVVVFEMDEIYNKADATTLKTSSYLYLAGLIFEGQIVQGSNVSSVEYLEIDGQTKSYASGAEAVAAINAVEEGTVKLLADLGTTSTLSLKYGVTLDLNGFSLYVGSFDGVVGNVIDSGIVHGVLISDGDASFNPSNELVALAHSNGIYAFYAGAGEALGCKPGEAVDSQSYWFRLNFTDKSAYELLNNDVNTVEATFKVYVDGTAYEDTYSFNANTIADYINLELNAAENQKGAMYLLVKNMNVASGKEVKIELTYTIGDNVLSTVELAYTYTA